VAHAVRNRRPGPELLLQIRTRVLNDKLATATHSWYPGFTHLTSETDTLSDQLLAAEVVPDVVDFEVAVPRLMPGVS
jgi:hypothetical protein